ncbi:MAG: ArsR/SmtB family transcription factor [bacterium]
MDAVLKAIAEPRRRAILRLVWNREMPAGSIAARFDVTRPAISQHLRILKRSGLLSERREGTRRLYRARQEGVRDLREYLEEFWEAGLRRLKLEAEAAERRLRRGEQRAIERRPQK